MMHCIASEGILDFYLQRLFFAFRPVLKDSAPLHNVANRVVQSREHHQALFFFKRKREKAADTFAAFVCYCHCFGF